MEVEASVPVEMDKSKVDESKQERKAKRKRKKSLFKVIRSQMEFYFSDSNLMKDKFLSQLVYGNLDGLVPLDVFFNFNKIRSLNCTKGDICNALSQSEILQVSEEKQQVRRITPVNVKTNVDQCTLYVEHLPADVDHDWIRNAFVPFGTIDYISLPRFKHKGNIKGFAFVEYSTPEEAVKACKHFGYMDEDSKDVDENMEHTPTKSKRKRGPSESEDYSKKRIRQTSTTETSNEDSLVQVPVKLEELVPMESNEVTPVEETKKEKKKRTRKKKRKHQEEQEKPVQTLRVMPKEEWKRWKNKYLSMQKETMSQIKRSLSGVEAPFKEIKQTAGKKEDVVTSQPKDLPAEKPLKNKDRPLKLVEGVIVRIKMKQPVENVSNIKAQMRSLGNVVYVDAKEGEKVVYLRFKTPEESQQIISLPDLPGKTRLLAGEEESTYWQKLEADRQAKFSNNTRKQRGTDKVLRKMEKKIKQNIHINFNN